jgi:hypothetical protein
MAITRTAEFGYNITATNASTTGALTIAQAIPAGYFAVVAFTGLSATAPSNITLTDSGSNTWTRSTLGRGVNASAANLEDVAVWSSKLTTGLTTSSTITISSTGGANWTKQVVAVAGFSDAVNGAVTYGGWSENTSNVAINIPSLTTPSTSGQTWFLFGACALINSGRGFVPRTGWAAGNKYLSSTGGSERGLVLFYRESAAGQTYTIPADTSGGAGITVAGGVGYINQGSGAPPVEPGYTAGTAKVRNGTNTAWIDAVVKVRNDTNTAWVDGTAKVRTT